MEIALQNHKMQQEEEARYNVINGKTLKEVKIKDSRKKDPLEPVRIAGTADQLIKADDLTCHGRLSDCLNGRLLGVDFIASEFRYRAEVALFNYAHHSGNTGWGYDRKSSHDNYG